MENANDLVEKIYFAAKYEDEEVLKEHQCDINEATLSEKEIDYFRIKAKNATALHYACAKGDLSAVELLLRYGADPLILDIGSSSWAPIHYAALLGHQNCVEILFRHDPKIISCTTGRERYHPIHTAVFANDTELIKWLIRNGAKINKRDKRGNTPIHTAAYLGYKACVRTLLNLGANHLLKNKKKKYPIDLAKSNGYGDVAEMLQRHQYATPNDRNISNTSLASSTDTWDSLDDVFEEAQLIHDYKNTSPRMIKDKNDNKMTLKGTMEGKILQKNFTTICNKIDATALSDYLFERELLTVDDLQELELRHTSSSNKSRSLLLRLFNMQLKVFYSLMDWLKSRGDTNSSILYNLLDHELQECRSGNST
ncbi:Ankyrin repeat, PH and SEC7 domain containing protein secG [Trichoplax sp. H2]|nr:Ankyrin repeat, PH and SEC7 domain containing protein secG [Trichoplax sp. H2]|eukprot:RDD44853.1 Ankyrin repeat, PH and SEC7 domain containing protein secG [Trichoplax sp. H2]